VRKSASRTEPPSLLWSTVHELMVLYKNKTYARALSDPRAEALRGVRAYKRIADRTTEGRFSDQVVPRGRFDDKSQ
jgi:hypothetical protein